MRYLPAHADTSGSVPFMLRGSKSLRTTVAVATAGIIGLVPAVMIASPASAAVNLTVAPASAIEGAPVSFTLHYTGSIAATYTISTTLTGGATASASDFNATPSAVSVTFAGTGAPDQTVTVATVDDALYEANETFNLHVVNNADLLSPLDAVGTINNNDTIPSYQIDALPITVLEAAGAKSTITATLSAVSGLAVPITLNTVDGTAVATRDYTALTNTAITIPAGQLTATADIMITNDMVRDESTTESFTVNSSATNVSPPTDTAMVNITDAQSDPVVTLTGGGSVTEGSLATYTVGIVPASEKAVTVMWNAVAATPVLGNGTATPVTDFAYPSPRTVTIPAGSSSMDFTISALVDSLDELNEDFAVELSVPANATLGANVKVNTTITDANTAPSIAVTPTSVIEGDSGHNTRTFTATLSAASGRDVNVGWMTHQSSGAPGYTFATDVKDFTPKSSTLTIPAGSTSQNFTVDISGDTVDEGSGETFDILLSNVDSSAVLGDGKTSIMITDDDSAPTISFADVTVKEGDAGSAVLLPLILHGSSDHPLTFDVDRAVSPGTAWIDGTGVGEHDYDLLTDEITIPSESTIPGYVVALVNGDYVYEADETANFTVTSTTGSLITDPDVLTARLTIENDDLAPDLEVNSVKGAEGTTVAVTGHVSGISATVTNVTVQFAGGSSNGSVAASANDFINPGARQIEIPAGTTPGTDLYVNSIPLIDDDAVEPAETIIGSGFGIGNVGTVTEGIVTIEASEGDTLPDPDAITLIGPYRAVAGPIDLTGMSGPESEVQLWSAPYSGGADDWIEGPTTTAGMTGAFAFTPTLAGTGRKFMVSSGDTYSDAVPVRLNQAPTLAGTSTSRGIAALRVGAGVPRMPFVIQRTYGKGWASVFTGNLMSTGTYYKGLPGQLSGRTVGYRVYVYGNSFNGIDSAYSSARYVRIK